MKTTKNFQKLLQAAKKAQSHSHSPYSRFPVGAAVLMNNGKIYSGCNVENSSFGGSICAERVAITKAISEGAKKILELVLVTKTSPPAAPCGICRQFISEFATKDLLIHCANPSGAVKTAEFSSLLPFKFSKADLFNT